MSMRETAVNIVNLMSDEQLAGFICLFKEMVLDIPNEETLAAMKEAESLLKDPNATKFSSVEDLFAELMS